MIYYQIFVKNSKPEVKTLEERDSLHPEEEYYNNNGLCCKA